MPTGENWRGANMASQLVSIGEVGRSGTIALSPKMLGAARRFNEESTFKFISIDQSFSYFRRLQFVAFRMRRP